MNYFSNKSILVISTEAWDHIPISKHHYSKALAQIGASVFFLNPPSGRNNLRVHESIPNLFIIDCTTFRGLNSLPRIFRDLVNNLLITRIKKLAGRRFDVIWSFDPYRFQNLQLFGAGIKIFHPVDIHQAKHEPQAAKTADIILSVSDLILNRFSEYKGYKENLGHGVQNYFLNKVPVKLSPQVKTIGYVGNLDNWCIDIETLLKVVDENKGLQFHFIGPYGDDSILANRLKQFSHCTLFGRVLSEELPTYFEKIDLFFMCYDGANKEVNSNHHKILEFLSTGKPAVLNFTDEYKTREELVIMSNDNNELPALMKNVVNNFGDYIKEDIVLKRIELARHNTYESHLSKIARMVTQHTDSF